MKKKYCSRFPLNRIKKIIRSDENIGKISVAVPVVLSCGIEQFCTDLLKTTIANNGGDDLLVLHPAHVKQTVCAVQKFDFLRDTLASAPDVVPEVKSKKAPRQPKSPRTPKTPKTPRTPKTPKTPKTPRTPKTPKTAKSRGKSRAKKAKFTGPDEDYDREEEDAQAKHRLRIHEEDPDYAHHEEEEVPTKDIIMERITEEGPVMQEAEEIVALKQKEVKEVPAVVVPERRQAEPIVQIKKPISFVPSTMQSSFRDNVFDEEYDEDDDE